MVCETSFGACRKVHNHPEAYVHPSRESRFDRPKNLNGDAVYFRPRLNFRGGWIGYRPQLVLLQQYLHVLTCPVKLFSWLISCGWGCVSCVTALIIDPAVNDGHPWSEFNPGPVNVLLFGNAPYRLVGTIAGDGIIGYTSICLSQSKALEGLFLSIAKVKYTDHSTFQLHNHINPLGLLHNYSTSLTF